MAQLLINVTLDLSQVFVVLVIFALFLEGSFIYFSSQSCKSSTSVLVIGIFALVLVMEVHSIRIVELMLGQKVNTLIGF